jgi:hypothetical protein
VFASLRAELSTIALKTILFLSNVFVCFENYFLTIERVRFTSKKISLLSNVFKLAWI